MPLIVIDPLHVIITLSELTGTLARFFQLTGSHSVSEPISPCTDFCYVTSYLRPLR